MQPIMSYASLSGPDKAAIMFLCLGDERSAELMRSFSDPEIRRVTSAMAGLGLVSSDMVEKVIMEFQAGVSSGGAIYGSVESAERLLASIFPREKVADMMSEIRGPLMGRNLWENFSSMNEQAIANYLAEEHDQTTAAMLSKLRPDIAAKVVPLLGEERAIEVMARMVNMDAVPRRVLESIEETIAQELLAPSAHRGSSDMTQRMADIFNKMDPSFFEAIGDQLDDRSPAKFAAIKQKMFTFEDLGRLDTQSLIRVVGTMARQDANAVPMALRGASKDLRAIFLNAQPRRARDVLEEEMENMGPVRAKDVQAAQGAMVDVALELVRNDEIQMPIDDDELI